MPLLVRGYMASDCRADEPTVAGLGSSLLARGSGPRPPPTPDVLARYLSGAVISRRSRPRAFEGASST
jgi:hypothetical protein